MTRERFEAAAVRYPHLARLRRTCAVGTSRAQCWTSSIPSRCLPARRCGASPNLVVTPHVSADDGDSYVALTLELARLPQLSGDFDDFSR